MTYNQSFYNSLIAGAYIKCTYIDIYSEAGTKLISLQRATFDKCLGYATYTPLIDKKQKVAITPTRELIMCLRDYSEIAKNNRYILEVINAKEPVLYIKNHCASWKAEKVEDKKSFWATIAAGISLFI